MTKTCEEIKMKDAYQGCLKAIDIARMLKRMNEARKIGLDPMEAAEILIKVKQKEIVMQNAINAIKMGSK